jgi:solute carrier family 25 protein 39/40
MSVPANVIYFVGYEYARDHLQPYTLDYSPLVAGSLARTVAVTVISPIELFRTRLQAATKLHSFKGKTKPSYTFYYSFALDVLEGVKKMVGQDGLKALWRGLPPTLWRDVPFSGIYWICYERSKSRIESASMLHLNDIQVSFISGALSGMVNINNNK